MITFAKWALTIIIALLILRYFQLRREQRVLGQSFSSEKKGMGLPFPQRIAFHKENILQAETPNDALRHLEALAEAAEKQDIQWKADELDLSLKEKFETLKNLRTQKKSWEELDAEFHQRESEFLDTLTPPEEDELENAKTPAEQLEIYAQLLQRYYTRAKMEDVLKRMESVAAGTNVQNIVRGMKLEYTSIQEALDTGPQSPEEQQNLVDRMQALYGTANTLADNL